jgi:hypothetical protein
MILTALANGSQHGYGIIIDVQEISGGRVRLRPGTLYSALDRLRADAAGLPTVAAALDELTADAVRAAGSAAPSQRAADGGASAAS